MEWLWLLLSVAGLGLLWLLIVAMDKLTLRLKEHDEARKITIKSIKQRTEEAEAEFLEEQSLKEEAKNYIINGDLGSDDPESKATLREAIDLLSSKELVQSVTKRLFGNPEGTDGITAQQSALEQVGKKKAVAKGDSVTPVKVRSSSKVPLSKAEQKMLKKIKQGD